MAACATVAALADADEAVSLDTAWPKAHVRRATALGGLLRFDDADNALAVAQATSVGAAASDVADILDLRRKLQRRAKQLPTCLSTAHAAVSKASVADATLSPPAGEHRPAVLARCHVRRGVHRCGTA